jgi:hypothetical protein
LIALESISVKVVEIGSLEISFIAYSDMVEEITREVVSIFTKRKMISNQEELEWLIELA